jgi:Protein of unknown function (DUF4242)
MAEFLVELYVSQGDMAAVERGAARARVAAEELSSEGRPVRYLRSIFVPEDETCFYLCEACSAAAVREVARRATLPFERVTEAMAAPKDDQGEGGWALARPESRHKGGNHHEYDVG